MATAGAANAQEQRSGDAVRLDPDAVSRAVSEKLAEALSIEDFGASTGAHDNKIPIERAIASALKGGRSIIVPPGTYRYSQIDLRRNDAVSPNRMVISGAGTLRSTFRGTSIVASEGPFYDLVIDGVRFESEAGAGTALIDGDRFIRLVFTPGTQINNFDWVIRGRDYLQSVRMLGTIIRGGFGAVVHAPMAYDCTFAHNIIEFVTDGIVIDGQNDPAANTCRINDNLIEGIGGRAIVLGTCMATSVSGNYLEGNVGGDILLNAGDAPHKGLKVENNGIQMSPRRIAENAFGIVWGKSTALPVRAGGNFCTGRLHDTTGVTAIIEMTGDFSQVELYKGHGKGGNYRPTAEGRAVYSDGLAQHFTWFDRYLALDPYHNEIRFGGKYRSKVGEEMEPPILTFGTSPPDRAPGDFDRKRWARGSVVLNAEPDQGRPFGWVCRVEGEPGQWMAIAART